ncbi:MAG TPA: FKBP-type peptidyl-prolyl cis-trans isomerase [Pirellulales bacterium]|nr:FKBP-type peptidyl-prolyl cis-trans isomerase [Pirellulales bacterium]
MKVRLLLVAALALMASPLAAQQPPQLRSLREKASYSFGMSMGDALRKQGVDIDLNLLVQGLKDATAGKTALTEEQAFEAMQAFEKEMVAQQAQKSQKFLAANKTRPGVQTTKSGLQYKVLKAGKGGRPKPNDIVRVNYRATFINGEEFERNGEKPFSTPVNQVIPGWREALQMMEVGSKWQLFIPPELAYGEQGSPPAIAPNTALVFDIELVAIAPPAAPGPPGAARGATLPPQARQPQTTTKRPTTK